MSFEINKQKMANLIPEDLINRFNLSWGALGLLLFLNTKDDGAIVTREEILESCSNSEQEIDEIILELRRAGL